MFTIKLTTQMVLSDSEEHTFTGTKYQFWQWFHNEFKHKHLHHLISASAQMGEKSLEKAYTHFIGESGWYHRYPGSKVRAVKDLVNEIHDTVYEITRPNGETYQCSKSFFTHCLNSCSELKGFSWRTI